MRYLLDTRELDNIARRRGFPLLVVSDNGTEFTSNVMLRWQQDQQVEWHYIAPGKAAKTDCTNDALRLVWPAFARSSASLPTREGPCRP